MAETEARREFRARLEGLLSGRPVNIRALERQLQREGYSRDVIPMALRGAGVSVDTEGRATISDGPRQQRLD